jgi:tetratricopeptide (TPR) repeat protein
VDVKGYVPGAADFPAASRAKSGMDRKLSVLRRTALLALAASALIGISGTAAADEMTARLEALGHAWAKVYYGMPESKQEPAYPALVDRAHAIALAYPARAEPLIWEAIILSCYAKAKGGWGALDIAKSARDVASAAAAIDDTALDAGAYTALGVLYYKVPGWPIGFGNDERAQEYLDKALAIAPDAVDVNYFYGDFMIAQGQKQKARPFLEKALRAPPRPGRGDEDAGRRIEIENDLAKIGDRAP